MKTQILLIVFACLVIIQCLEILQQDEKIVEFTTTDGTKAILNTTKDFDFEKFLNVRFDLPGGNFTTINLQRISLVSVLENKTFFYTYYLPDVHITNVIRPEGENRNLIVEMEGTITNITREDQVGETLQQSFEQTNITLKYKLNVTDELLFLITSLEGGDSLEYDTIITSGYILENDLPLTPLHVYFLKTQDGEYILLAYAFTEEAYQRLVAHATPPTNATAEAQPQMQVPEAQQAQVQPEAQQQVAVQ